MTEPSLRQRAKRHNFGFPPSLDADTMRELDLRIARTLLEEAMARVERILDRMYAERFDIPIEYGGEA